MADALSAPVMRSRSRSRDRWSQDFFLESEQRPEPRKTSWSRVGKKSKLSKVGKHEANATTSLYGTVWYEKHLGSPNV